MDKKQNNAATADLLKAAVMALKAFQMDSDMEKDFAPEIKALRKAIKKAEGE